MNKLLLKVLFLFIKVWCLHSKIIIVSRFYGSPMDKEFLYKKAGFGKNNYWRETEMAYLALIIILVISFYTVLFALEELKRKNYHGFIAIIFLVLIIIMLPFYFLFLRG